jgi:hypothetical protein
MQNVELGQTKVMQIRQRETLNHQGAITHEVCCLAAQLRMFVGCLMNLDIFQISLLVLKFVIGSKGFFCQRIGNLHT